MHPNKMKSFKLFAEIDFLVAFYLKKEKSLNHFNIGRKAQPTDTSQRSISVLYNEQASRLF